MTSVDAACKRLGDAIERKQRKRPLPARRMDCPGCDCFVLCKQVTFKDGSHTLLCSACASDAKAYNI